MEMIATGTARHDIARYGSELFRASPRQADVLIVSGRVSNKMAPVIKRIYDQMSDPKWVIAMGICASVGGPFNNYAIIQGVDKIIPVDVYVPGCPPRPEALLYALDKLREKQGNEKIAKYKQREAAGVFVPSHDGGSLEALRVKQPV
jgi:NADH-quinone oxidoreductase subunit B